MTARAESKRRRTTTDAWPPIGRIPANDVEGRQGPPGGQVYNLNYPSLSVVAPRVTSTSSSKIRASACYTAPVNTSTCLGSPTRCCQSKIYCAKGPIRLTAGPVRMYGRGRGRMYACLCSAIYVYASYVARTLKHTTDGRHECLLGDHLPRNVSTKHV